jgi:hypothetical protein
MSPRPKLSRMALAGVWLGLAMTAGAAAGQDVGGVCNPDASVGHAARLAAMSGTVTAADSRGTALALRPGVAIPAGATVETAAGGRAELAFEDGTASRASRLRLGPESRVVITGGIYCSDLRPKVNEGRWSVREVGFVVGSGAAVIELARGVSHAFNMDVTTPNAVARLVRGTLEPMSAAVRVTGLPDRVLVHPVDHPRIRLQIQAMLMGGTVEELPPRQQEQVKAQAVMTAFAMGFLDMQEMGLLENPQIRSMIQMMTRGRPLADLSETERATVSQGAATLAVQQGLLNVQEIRVHSQPDELTRITMGAGTLRVHNRHLGYRRDDAVRVEAGTVLEVRGYDVPVRAQLD